jgi:hypothetical protein
MKKIMLLLLVLPLAGKAQFNKGDMFLGGALSGFTRDSPAGSSSTITNDVGNSFNVGPKFGYFISEKWAIGGSLGYTHSSSTQDQVAPNFLSHYNTSSFGFTSGLFARRYFAIADKFFFTLEGSLAFSRSNSITSNSTVDYQGSGPIISSSTYKDPIYLLGATVRPIFIFFPTPKWGIEAGLGSLYYTHQHGLSDGSSVNIANLSVTSATSLGIYYYFRKK